MTWVLGLGESYDYVKKWRTHKEEALDFKLFFFLFFLVVGKTSICLMLKAHKLIKGLILFFDMHFYSEGSNDAYYYDLLYIPDPRD